MHSRIAPIVAVVDDDPRFLESLAELLESSGFDTRLFRSGIEFLQSGAVGAVQCLVSDIRMPGMDGWALESAVGRARPDLPVILITGNDVPERETHLPPPCGPRRFIFRKPFESRDLLAAVRVAIDNPPK
jgi:FixJ family two-component response regulator